MRGTRIDVYLHKLWVRPFVRKLLTWLRRRPIVVCADENQQGSDDGPLGGGPPPAVDRDDRDDLASRVREFLSQGRERRVLARDTQRGAASMRNAKDRDLVGPYVGTCGERRRGEERILRPLRNRDQRCEVAYLDVSAGTKAVRQIRC